MCDDANRHSRLNEMCRDDKNAQQIPREVEFKNEINKEKNEKKNIKTKIEPCCMDNATMSELDQTIQLF